MKRAAILTIFILTFPALCQGSVNLEPVPELSGIWWNALELDLEFSPMETFRITEMELFPALTVRGLNDPNNIAPINNMVSPDNMISMASFVWAELTGSVDIVAEVRTFSRQWRKNGRRTRAAASRITSQNASRNSNQNFRKTPDTRSRWKIVVGCRIDDNMELAARFDTRGNLLNEKRVAWQLSAADIFPDEIGLTTVYRDGRLMIETDRVSITERAMAKVVVRF